MKRALAILMLAFASLTLAAPAAVADGDQHVPVSICHRTASDTNPYVFITVDDDSLSPGHLDNADPGHKPKFWKSDGTWRGVDHVAGDPKDDYLAESAADCEDTAPPTDPPPTEPPPTEPPPTEEPPAPPVEPPGDCDASCKPPTVAYTGIDATDALATALLLAAAGGIGLWVARKTRRL